MAGTTGVRRVIRWGLRHGLVRRAIERQMRAGELGARIMMDRDVQADPFPHYEALRTKGRLVDTGIALITADHALSTAVLRSPDFGTVTGAAPPPGLIRLAIRAGGHSSLGPVERPSMLATDPPDHTRYRKLVTRAFSARAVAALRTRTEQVAEELLDAMTAKGRSADLIDDYASLLPATVIAETLGAPVAMRHQFLEWGAGGALSLDLGLSYRDFRRSERDIDALHAWMLGHFDRLRRSPGGVDASSAGASHGSSDAPSAGASHGDILSALVAAHDEDGRLSEDELSSVGMLLLAAGFETTVNLIGNGVVQLARHPEQLAKLAAEPARWAGAVEEVLRYDSPVQRTARVAKRDTEVAGERVRAGQLVIMLIGGANRDPAVFADPHRFDVTRPDAGAHIAFSSGIHYCIGAGLARMEGEVGLQALFRRFPDLTLAGEPHRRPTRVLRGYDAMPVTLDPATVSA
ncbi:MAG: cytochrome P450 [Pseudonocardia sp.]